MTPTDQLNCRTPQNTEHRKIGNSNESKIGETKKNRKKENMKKPEIYREPMHMKIIQIHTPYHDWRDWLHKARRRRDPYFKELSYCEINSEVMKFYRKRNEKNEKLHKEISLSSLVSINIRKNGLHSTCLIEMFSSTGQIINLKLSNKQAAINFKSVIESFLETPLHEVAMVAEISHVNIIPGITNKNQTKVLYPGTKLIMWTRNHPSNGPSGACPPNGLPVKGLKTVVIKDFSSRLPGESIEIPRKDLHRWSFDDNNGQFVDGKVWTTELCSLGAISFSIIFHDCQKFKYDFHPLLDPKRAPVAIQQQQNSNPPLSAKAQEVEKWNRWNENRIRARSGTKTYPSESAGSPGGGGANGGTGTGVGGAEKPSRSSTLNSTGNHSYSLNSC